MRAVILFSVFGFALPVLVLVLSLSVWWDIDGLRAPFARVLEILVFGFVLTAIAYVTHQVMLSLSKNVPGEPIAIAILAARWLQGLLVILLLLASWFLFAMAAATFLDAIAAAAEIDRPRRGKSFSGCLANVNPPPHRGAFRIGLSQESPSPPREGIRGRGSRTRNFREGYFSRSPARITSSTPSVFASTS